MITSRQVAIEQSRSSRITWEFAGDESEEVPWLHFCVSRRIPFLNDGYIGRMHIVYLRNPQPGILDGASLDARVQRFWRRKKKLDWGDLVQICDFAAPNKKNQSQRFHPWKHISKAPIIDR